LRKICIDRQIKENIEKINKEKKEKVKLLSEVQERIKEKRFIESSLKDNLI